MPDVLKVLPQYLLPQRALSAAMHRFMACPWPWVKNTQIQVVRRLYDIDLREALEPDPGAYRTFNHFFTRALRPEARPLAPPGCVACPCDGTVVASGRVGGGRLLQAKGRDYRLGELLGHDPEMTAALGEALHITLYLSPRDYHRVHMPWDGRLQRMRHIPGRLFSVSPATTRRVPRLFGRNERLVSLFEAPEGRFAVVLVGALFVGSMETVWAGKVTPPYGRQVTDHAYGEVPLARGAEMGRFNMGSTVILLMDLPGLAWADGLVAGTRVRMGECLGRVAGT